MQQCTILPLSDSRKPIAMLFGEKYKNSQYVDDFNRDNWKDWGFSISVTDDDWHEIYLDDH